MIQPYDYEKGTASDTPKATTKFGGGIKPYNYGSVEPVAPAPEVKAHSASIMEKVKSFFTPKDTGAKSMEFRVGEGMTPEQTFNAKDYLANQPETPGIDIKYPFVQAGTGKIPSEGGQGFLNKIGKSLIEFPERATRSLTELAGITNQDSETRTKAYTVPSYAEFAGKTTGQLIDEGVPATAAVILASAAVSGEFANDALMYLDPIKGNLKSTKIEDTLTKDIIRKTNPETVRFFNSNEVKDIWKTGKLLSEVEKSDIIKVLGGDKTKIKYALDNGISIKVPENSIVLLQDKPYWSKIKQFFGKTPSTGKIIVEGNPIPVQTVRGYLTEGQTPAQSVKEAITKISRPVEEVPAVTKAVEQIQPKVEVQKTTGIIDGEVENNIQIKTKDGNSITFDKKVNPQVYNGKREYFQTLNGEAPNGEKISIRYMTDSDGETLKILNFASEAKGKGYGTDLLNSIIEDAKQNGIKKIIAKDVNYHKATVYWEKQGFKNIGNADMELDLSKPKSTITVKPSEKTKGPIEIAGKEVTPPEQLVTKTGLKDLLAGTGKKSADFTVIEKNDTMYMSYDDGKTKMLVRPSALGLVEDGIKIGDTININAEDLKDKGTALRGVDSEGQTVAKEYKPGTFNDKVKPSSTPEEFAKKIEQLNKFGQSQRILRRTRGLKKSAAGVFTKGKSTLGGKKGRGEVRLQENVVMSPKDYMETLAHELGHGLENALFGSTNTKTLDVFGDNLDSATKSTLLDELIKVTVDLEGQAAVNAKPEYFLKKTELLARFFQKMFESPGNLETLAPTAVEMIHENALKHPIIQEYLEAAQNGIDKAPISIFGHEIKPSFLPDYKQSLQQALGERVGGRVFDEMNVYRAMRERAKSVISDFVKSKFKDVKDSPDLLFRAIEGMKVTKGGEPEFGTRDFQSLEIKKGEDNRTGSALDALFEIEGPKIKFSQKEAKRLLDMGYEPIKDKRGNAVMEYKDGKEYMRFARERYSPEEAKRYFDQLSPEGKQLAKDFTASLDEAKDLFNREVIKQAYKVESDVEGWVHHYFEGDSGTISGKERFKLQKAGARKHRTGTEGYVEDFQKAMTKALVDFEGEKAINDFTTRVFPMVTKPIVAGQAPDVGWVEVQGNLKKGVGTGREVRSTIIDEKGNAVPTQQVRYQMPVKIYKKFQLLKEITEEASTALKVINSLTRYWQTNILVSVGSASTNMISGALQYSSKILTDFYTELLTGNVKMEKTRSNIYAMMRVLNPKGWEKAPDWAYGGDQSNFYGQFTKSNALETGLDNASKKALKLYGTVERYWKKVISTAENVGDLGNLSKVTKEGLALPTEEERQMLAELNEEIDTFAYDYDNVPLWLEAWAQNPIGASLKPFMKYPYKYMKQVSGMVSAPFDPNIPWQERMAKLMAIVTLMTATEAVRERQKSKQKTKEGDVNTPTSVSPRGQMYVGTDKDGKENFVRISKYPFFNISSTGMLLADGQWEAAKDSVTDMVGSVAPAGQLAAFLLGYQNKYQAYTPAPAVLGQATASFVPGTRILSDAGRYFDPFQRKNTTFSQPFTSLYPLPISNEDLRAKLRGPIKTLNVPIEGKIKDTPGNKTTLDVALKNYKEDILLSALTGIFVRKIDPDVADAFSIREKENAKSQAKSAKKAVNKKVYTEIKKKL